jgi:hypothetical protein
MFFAIARTRVALDTGKLFSSEMDELHRQIASEEFPMRLRFLSKLICCMTLRPPRERADANDLCCDIIGQDGFSCSSCQQQLASHWKTRYDRLKKGAKLGNGVQDEYRRSSSADTSRPTSVPMRPTVGANHHNFPASVDSRHINPGFAALAYSSALPSSAPTHSTSTMLTPNMNHNTAQISTHEAFQSQSGYLDQQEQRGTASPSASPSHLQHEPGNGNSRGSSNRSSWARKLATETARALAVGATVEGLRRLTSPYPISSALVPVPSYLAASQHNTFVGPLQPSSQYHSHVPPIIPTASLLQESGNRLQSECSLHCNSSHIPMKDLPAYHSQGAGNNKSLALSYSSPSRVTRVSPSALSLSPDAVIASKRVGSSPHSRSASPGGHRKDITKTSSRASSWTYYNIETDPSGM